MFENAMEAVVTILCAFGALGGFLYLKVASVKSRLSKIKALTELIGISADDIRNWSFFLPISGTYKGKSVTINVVGGRGAESILMVAIASSVPYAFKIYKSWGSAGHSVSVGHGADAFKVYLRTEGSPETDRVCERWVQNDNVWPLIKRLFYELGVTGLSGQDGRFEEGDPTLVAHAYLGDSDSIMWESVLSTMRELEQTHTV